MSDFDFMYTYPRTRSRDPYYDVPDSYSRYIYKLENELEYMHRAYKSLEQQVRVRTIQPVLTWEVGLACGMMLSGLHRPEDRTEHDWARDVENLHWKHVAEQVNAEAEKAKKRSIELLQAEREATQIARTALDLARHQLDIMNGDTRISQHAWEIGVACGQMLSGLRAACGGRFSLLEVD